MARGGPEQEQGTLRPRGTPDASGRRITPETGDAPRPRVCRRHRLGKPMLGNRMSAQTPRAGMPLVILAGNHEQDTHWLGSILESAGYAVLREPTGRRSEEHTSELQSLAYLVCRLLLEKKNK